MDRVWESTPNRATATVLRVFFTHYLGFAAVAVAAMLEAGQTPPQPAAFMKRTTQVNIRLTHEEKAMIAAAAAKAGFKGLADFIRTTILDRVLFNR